MKQITLSHGSGGEETHELIENLFYKYFNNDKDYIKLNRKKTEDIYNDFNSSISLINGMASSIGLIIGLTILRRKTKMFSNEKVQTVIYCAGFILALALICFFFIYLCCALQNIRFIPKHIGNSAISSKKKNYAVAFFISP